MTLSFNIKGRGYWKASGFRLNHVWSSFFDLSFDLKSVLFCFFSGLCEKFDRLIEMINELSNAPIMTAKKQKQLFYAVYLCKVLCFSVLCLIFRMIYVSEGSACALLPSFPHCSCRAPVIVFNHRPSPPLQNAPKLSGIMVMTSSGVPVRLFTWQKPEAVAGFVSHIVWCHTWVTGIIKTYGKIFPRVSTCFFFKYCSL